jgi:hypothetical protein
MNTRVLFALLSVVLAPTWAYAGDVPKPPTDKKRLANIQDGIWLGPQVWANPMEDWQGGRNILDTPPHSVP